MAPSVPTACIAAWSVQTLGVGHPWNQQRKSAMATHAIALAAQTSVASWRIKSMRQITSEETMVSSSLFFLSAHILDC